MDKIYTNTIEECKKQIIDKNMILDIGYINNYNLLECFIRMVRTIMLWAMVILPIITCVKSDPKSAFFMLGILAFTYMIGCILISWVKYNYRQSHTEAKRKLCDDIIANCKEFKEAKYEEWEERQVIEDLVSLANLKIEWKNTDKSK